MADTKKEGGTPRGRGGRGGMNRGGQGGGGGFARGGGTPGGRGGRGGSVDRNAGAGGRGGSGFQGRGGGRGGGYQGGQGGWGGGRQDFAMQRLQEIQGPTHELPPIDTSERQFSGRSRLYIGNIGPGVTEESLKTDLD